MPRRELARKIHEGRGADFDNDGDLDVVIVSEDDRLNELLINDGLGNFSDASTKLPVEGTSNAVEIVDINSDGLPDIMIGNNGQNRLIVNIGNAVFLDETEERLPLANDTTQDIDFGDIDGDGDLDLVVGNEGDNKLLVNDGEGNYSDVTDSRLPLAAGQEVTREVDLGDIDGDGDLDILFANVTSLVSGGNSQNRILLNNGSGVFEDVTELNYPSSKERSFEGDFIDLDQDGDLDIMTGNLPGSGSSPVPFSVFLNDGTGFFSKDSTKIFGADVVGFGFDIVVGDVNGDLIDDLFLANRGSSDVLLLGEED